VRWVLADGEFDAEINHVYIHQILGAQSAIPAFPRGSPRRRRRLIGRYRERMRTAFPRRVYRQRALSETVFSVVKRKLSARAPGRSVATQCRQALLLGLAYDIYRLKPRLLIAGGAMTSTEPDRVRRSLASLGMTRRPALPPYPSCRLTRCRIRSYSARDAGVSLRRPKPVSSSK
jgi:hypothetical protein